MNPSEQDIEESSPPKKIPYPTEGVIRSANIDDTVAPTNSAQLVINMNFDQIGAMKTRPGVTSYADVLGNGITNYGVLRNSYPDGFNRIIQLGSEDSFAAFGAFITAAKVDNTHIIAFWSDASFHGQVQIMQINTDSGGTIALGSPTTFENTNDFFNKCIQIDTTHYLNVWRGVSNTGYAQVFTVDPVAYTVTPASTVFQFDATTSTQFSLAQIDTTHVIVFYEGNGSVDGMAVVLAINASTYAVTKPGSALTFASGSGGQNSCAAIGDGVHFVNFWGTKAQTFSVNTSTWAITAIGSALTFDASGSSYNSVQSFGDGVHFMNFWTNGSSNGKVQVFNVNASTFAVTALSSTVQFATVANQNASVSLGNGTNFVNFWSDGSDNGYSQVFAVTPSTYAVTATGTPNNFGGLSTIGRSIAAVEITTYRIQALWATKSSNGLEVGAMFKVQASLVPGFLYAQSADTIYNLSGTTWTARRTGCAQVSKARFAQFLGYLWMVDGNKTIGGDPIQTSNGSNFGTELVPANFPQGDFISAGFEGRVWVVDKSAGIIYYTDIVQFTPYNSYTLTYDPTIDFISTIAPQTGQQFTGIIQVPRALLVFTQDFIWRIYGATSIDAYPAYSVGTYSQESIVQTKTGVFFHHSSGFYQFDYGSQPVEISRRIIDFIKAIPRSYYPNITGVYDGFDAILWSIGPVTVEGINFANCIIRYTLSTQVWTIYDYVGNTIKAMIQYDDGTTLNHLMGTSAGKTGAMDTGNTDFGNGFYYEWIDRWRSYSDTDVYALVKQLTGMNVYSDNASGANLYFQSKDDGVNEWEQIMSIKDDTNSLIQSVSTDDFNVGRLRLTGNSKGAPVVIHGVETMNVLTKGYDTN